jgi:hypothetical protein
LNNFKRDFNVQETLSKIDENPIDQAKVTAASMEGKLKEKLESTGIALLCLSISPEYQNPINNLCNIRFNRIK